MWDWISQNWDHAWLAVQGVALAATAWVAWYQLSSLREDQKNWETLKACEKYDTDPVITEALKRLRDARNSKILNSDPKSFSLEMTTVLNYLEGMIIGVEQNFYNEAIVRNHMEPIMRDHVREFLSEPLRAVMVDKDDDYSMLSNKIQEWTKSKTFFRRKD